MIDNIFGDANDDDVIRESRVSKKFQEMTTKRVVSIVLICIMSGAFMSPDLYIYNDNYNEISDYLVILLGKYFQFDSLV